MLEIDVQNNVSEYYETQRYEKFYSKMYHEWWNNKMFSLLTKRGRILDNGCGTGLLSEMKALSSESIIGMDISEGMLKYASLRMKNIICADAMSSPFKSNSFDIIIARSLLHHLNQPHKALEEMYRIARQNAEIVLVDTNQSLLSYIPRMISSKGAHFSDDHKNMNYKVLIKMIQQYFSIDHIHFFGYFAYPLGFPDIFDFGNFFSKVHMRSITRLLITVDALISKIPFINKQSWGIMIKATKKGLHNNVN